MKRDGQIAFNFIALAMLVPIGFVVSFCPPNYRINVFVISAVLLICLWKFFTGEPKNPTK